MPHTPCPAQTGFHAQHDTPRWQPLLDVLGHPRPRRRTAAGP